MDRILRVANGRAAFSGSIWSSVHILLDREEWVDFFQEPILDRVFLFRSSGIHAIESLKVSSDDFLRAWDRYMTALTDSTKVNDSAFRQDLSLYMTLSDSAVAIQEVSQMRGMIIPTAPSVTMQLHRFRIGLVDEQEIGKIKPKILSAVFGPQTISWGVTLSYPQIAQNGITKEIVRALQDPSCENRLLWRAIQAYIRKITVPFPLIIQGVPIWAPIRIGRRAISWIQRHQELIHQPDIRINYEALNRVPN